MDRQLPSSGLADLDKDLVLDMDFDLDKDLVLDMDLDLDFVLDIVLDLKFAKCLLRFFSFLQKLRTFPFAHLHFLGCIRHTDTLNDLHWDILCLRLYECLALSDIII